jgi:hypothetical protein
VRQRIELRGGFRESTRILDLRDDCCLKLMGGTPVVGESLACEESHFIGSSVALSGRTSI